MRKHTILVQSNLVWYKIDEALHLYRQHATYFIQNFTLPAPGLSVLFHTHQGIGLAAAPIDGYNYKIPYMPLIFAILTLL